MLLPLGFEDKINHTVLNYLANADTKELASINGVGEKVARAIKDWFAVEKHLSMINDLLDLGISFNEEADTKEQNLVGKVFVITGSFDGFSRNELKKQLQDRGARVSSSVSPSTFALLVGNKPGSKLEKAIKYGIDVVYEEEILKFFQ